MSERALKRLVGALVVVGGVWLVSLLFRGGSGSIAATGPVASFFEDLDRTTVERVRIEHEGDPSITLARGAEEDWTVNDLRADAEAVSRLLDVLDEAEIGDLIAANPDNHARMGVSTDSAYAVSFSVGGDERSLLVGKSARRFGTAYVRLPDADEVYLLDADLRAQLTRDLDAWRDRTMAAVDTSAVARIVVERARDGYALVRGDSAWTFDGGGPVSESGVAGILAELARMVATGFVQEADSLAAFPEDATTTALTADGEVLVRVTLGEGEGDRWARSSASGDLYRVSSFRANRVAPARETLSPGS
jgi:hypothetical protein